MLASILAAALTAVAPTSAPAPTFRPLAYEVALRPDFATGVLTGTERIRLQSLGDGVDAIAFTANAMAVNATLDGVATPATIEGDRRVFHLPRRLARGERATLAVSFAGRPGRGTVFTADEIHTGYFTCETMICDTERPGDRARVELSLTLPVGDEAAGPGRLVSRSPAGPGLETWRWREERPYPSYLYGFAAGRYARAALPGRPDLPDRPVLQVLSAGESPERIQAMFADTARMVAFYADKAGAPLPEGRYTQVLVDDNGDQEDIGLSMIEKGSAEPILADPQKDGLVAHELAHQWWGNLVTCADWKELWLNEGLTGFMVAAYKEQRWGHDAYEREIDLGRRAWAAAQKAGMDRPLSDQGTYPSLRDKRRIAYGKSVVFLDALRAELGDAAFWAGMRGYIHANAGRSVTAADLQHAFEAASGRDLSGLFRTWVFGDGVG